MPFGGRIKLAFGGKMKIHFLADKKKGALPAWLRCVQRYGQAPLTEADFVVVLGGDGFMLKTLHALLNYRIPVFGLNLGHVGYLLNRFSVDNLPKRIEQAEKKEIVPLRISASTKDGQEHELYAFNEAVVLRSSAQAARLETVMFDFQAKKKVTLQTLLGDGLIVATPMGSHGYYASASGQPLGNQQNVMAVQSICTQPRFNKIVSNHADIFVHPQELGKRPIHLECDGIRPDLPNLTRVRVQTAIGRTYAILKEKQNVR